MRELGATGFELGSVNSIASLGSTLLAIPLGILHDKYSLRKLFVFGTGLVALASFFYAVAVNWIMIIPAIILTQISMRFHCNVICDLSLQNETRSTAKSLCEGVGSTPSLFAPLVATYLITFFGGTNVEGIRPLYWIQLVANILLFILLILVSYYEIFRTTFLSANAIRLGLCLQAFMYLRPLRALVRSNRSRL